MNRHRQLLRIVLVCASALLAHACEATNRIFYDLNEGLDAGVFRPAATIYTKLTPKPLRQGVSNVFDNLGYLDTVLNDFLQGKLCQGGRDGARLLINTTAGIGGIFDVASKWGYGENQEDFGQTLGVWGLGQGPYIVLPVLGPTTLRDLPGKGFTEVTKALVYFNDEFFDDVVVIEVLDRRSRLAGALEARDRSAADPYVFTREAYLQRRLFLVYDGKPPRKDEIEELESLLEGLGNEP
jgi:phospholipid-binding lipoprotein MlaA